APRKSARRIWALVRLARLRSAPKKLAESSLAPARLVSSSTAPVKSASPRLRPDRSSPDRSQKAKTARAPPTRPAYSISWRAAACETCFWVSFVKLRRRGLEVMGPRLLDLALRHCGPDRLTPD